MNRDALRFSTQEVHHAETASLPDFQGETEAAFTRAETDGQLFAATLASVNGKDEEGGLR